MFTHPRRTPRITHHKPVFCLFGYRAIFAHKLQLLILAGISSALLIPAQGCGTFGSSPKDDSGSLKDEGSAVFNDNEALDIPDFDANSDEQDAFQWSIVLVTLPKPEMAPVVLNTVQTKFGLLSAYITERADKTVISYGKYTGPDDRRALLDLDRVREMQSDGSRPFAAAFLAPPSGDALSGKNAEFDLRTVKERFGPAALYTLQIGVYGTVGQTNPSPAEILEFRASAEQAVSELREQGERAFYYHAPLRSTVTIGVFGEGDFDGSTTPAIESGRLKELRKRFPYNYLNGQGLRETITSSSGQRVTRLQPSSLVGIPK